MNERTGVVTMRGNPVTLLGNPVNEGSLAPDFTAVKTDLSPVKLSAYRGKTVVISSVPSLDTPVCDLQTRRFNEEAGKLGENVVVLTLSMDLPFAQKRWCGAAGVDHVIPLSDHRDAEFGQNWGVLIKEFRLLARAVFVVDPKGVVKYAQIVPEIASEPNYAKALAAVKASV